MNYIDQARWWLQHYPQVKASIPNLEEELKTLYAELCPAGIASRFDPDLGSRSTAPRDMIDTVEEVAGNPRVAALRTEIKWARKMVEKVDMAIETLNETERRIVILRYREGFEWKEIARAMNLHARNCQRRADRTLLSIAVALWGPKAGGKIAAFSPRATPENGGKIAS